MNLKQWLFMLCIKIQLVKVSNSSISNSYSNSISSSK